MTEKQLHGRNRIVLDGLASHRECKSLMELVKRFGTLGDGYDGKRSPHSKMEKFEGISLNRVVFLTYFRLLNPSYLRLFLRVTDDIMKQVQESLNIYEDLYFTFTHIVCRSAIPDSPRNRTDFSHNIHGDNCILLTNGTCQKELPAYTWRDYSAILYLNDDFEGGEFVFVSDSAGANIESTIKPKCGRMIAFSSGGENLHGVKAVKKGSRCSVGIWFTHNTEQAESDRLIAQNMLEDNVNFHLFSSVNISTISIIK